MKISNLYQLTSNYETVLNMLYDEEIDEQMILDTLEGIEGEIEDKADGYAKIIKELEAKKNARKEEAKRLTESAKVFENRVNTLKSNLFNAMKQTGKTKFATDLFSFNIAKNGGKQPLTMGDATIKIEEKVEWNKVDVLKVAHHGSDSSTSQEFLDRVKPKYAIISVGASNSFNLPNKDIIDRLNNNKIKVYRTDKNETIWLTSDGTEIKINSLKYNLDGTGRKQAIIFERKCLYAFFFSTLITVNRIAS